MTAVSDLWRPVHDELAHWLAAGRTARLWLRDDDVIEVTPALRRLSDFAWRHDVPVLMAAIPARATDELASYFAGAPLLDPAVHGYAHVNHARLGDKTQEFPPHRGSAVITAELKRGVDRLRTLFGERLQPIYVPPWNRIAPEVEALLPALGFAGLSAFGSRRLPPPGSGLGEIDTHVDIINWKGGRVGRPHEWLARELAAELARARADGRPHVGVLAHHLVHDETAWAFLDGLLGELRGHPAVRWVRAAELLPARS